MKRLIRLYAIFCAALVIGGILVIQVISRSGTAGAIRRLGGSRSDFMEARTLLLLSSDNPVGALVRFSAKKRPRVQARIDALSIVYDYLGRQSTYIDSTMAYALLSDTTPAVLHAALRVLERARCPYALDVISGIFAASSDTALIQQCWRTMRTGSEQIERILANPGQSDSSSLEEAAARLAPLPCRKASCYAALAGYFTSRGDYTRAQNYADKTRPIDAWWIVGGWENRSMVAFHKQLSPETRPFNPSDTFIPISGEVARWFPLTTLRRDPVIGQWINLEQLFVRKLYSAAVLLTFVHSPSERDALVLLGSDDGVVVTLNGQRVYEHKVFRPAVPDEDVAKVHLRKGANVLMVKVLQDLGGWGVTARIADLRGEAMSDVTTSLSDSVTVSDITARTLVVAGVSMEQATALSSRRDLIDSIQFMIADTAQSTHLREKSVEVLRTLNSLREAPSGEECLVKTADRLIANGETGALLKQILAALLDLDSRKAASLSLPSSEPDLRFFARQFSNRKFREKLLAEAAKIDSPEFDKKALLNTFTRQPIYDAWTLDRISEISRAVGDTVRADSLGALLSMPRRWIAVNIANAPSEKVWDEYRERIGTHPFAKLHRDPPSVNDLNFALSYTLDTLANGFSQPMIAHGLTCAPGGHTMILATEVESDRDADAWLCVSLSAPYLVRINGIEIGQSRVSNGYRFIDARYPRQPRLFDIQHFPIRMKRGKNSIALVVTGSCIPTIEPYFRCAFRDNEGRPVGCKDLTIIWQDKQ